MASEEEATADDFVRLALLQLGPAIAGIGALLLTGDDPRAKRHQLTRVRRVLDVAVADLRRVQEMLDEQEPSDDGA